MKKNFWSIAGFPIFLMIVFIIAVVGVVNLGKSLNNPPELVLDNPTDIPTNVDEVTISGKTNPKASLTVNGKKVSVASDGSFTTTAKITEPEQTIEVIATRWYSQTTEDITAHQITSVVAVNTSTDTPTATISEVANSDLATSGPAENVMGSIGLTSLIVAYIFYRESKSKDAISAYKAFTLS